MVAKFCKIQKKWLILHILTKKHPHQWVQNCAYMWKCYSNRAYIHGYCSSCIHYFNIIFIYYKNLFHSFFSSLSYHLSNTNMSQYTLPISILTSSSHLLFSSASLSSCSFSSPWERMWPVWGFCSPMRRVDQLGVISIDRFWGKFLQKGMGFSHWDFRVFFFFGLEQDSWEFL